MVVARANFLFLLAFLEDIDQNTRTKKVANKGRAQSARPDTSLHRDQHDEVFPSTGQAAVTIKLPKYRPGPAEAAPPRANRLGQLVMTWHHDVPWPGPWRPGDLGSVFAAGAPACPVRFTRRSSVPAAALSGPSPRPRPPAHLPGLGTRTRTPPANSESRVTVSWPKGTGSRRRGGRGTSTRNQHDSRPGSPGLRLGSV